MTGSLGPLAGLRVVELAALGPVPFAATMLADMGAEVIRVDRPETADGGVFDTDKEILHRGRRSISVDLTTPQGRDLVLRLCERSDVLLEGHRPGVSERLGVGPDDCIAVNSGLIYVRCTGWGQDGPLAKRAGHDLTYTAVSGALGAIGEVGRKPVPALNLIADFGGGGAFAVIGVLASLYERTHSGRGQVVDAAMIDGTSYLLSSIFTMVNSGQWTAERGTNLLDGGTPFYDTYACADGRYVAVAALEPKFWRVLVTHIGLPVDPATQWDTSTWPDLRELLTSTFAARTQAEWTNLLEGVDACVAPVNTLDEAPFHPQLMARDTHIKTESGFQPAPAPRFSRTPSAVGGPAEPAGSSTGDLLRELGLTHSDIAALEAAGIVAQTTRKV